jgi:hypothetical protein
MKRSLSKLSEKSLVKIKQKIINAFGKNVNSAVLHKISTNEEKLPVAVRSQSTKSLSFMSSKKEKEYVPYTYTAFKNPSKNIK